MADRILQPGRNCWRIEPARRFAFLVDGEAYFGAVRNALAQARHSIYILGWDIDSRLRLTRNGEQDGYPVRLGDFLNALAHRRSDLHIHVLVWDFAMIYALEREWLPIYKLGWQTHRRLHFRMDSHHPPGASQHQKVVVVDDTLAFVGGMDLSKWRWDTPDHYPLDPRRSEGILYPPYHDVQTVFTGPAATAMAELARERWQRASGEVLSPPPTDHADPWPEKVVPDLTDVPLAIARTLPHYNGWPAVREVERLYEDAIRAARHHIYIENQYFTSQALGELLASRLAEPDGPELVMVLPRRSNGWLEQHTMDVLRARTLERLLAADRHGRLGVFYPDQPEVHPAYINVHDKVLVVDNRLVRVGSANLANRSMALDSECDIAIEAGGDPRIGAVVARFRDRLLAEHLGTTAEQVAARTVEKGSLLHAVESLCNDKRSLRRLPPEADRSLEEWLPDDAFVDPERPIAAELLVDRLVTEEARPPARRHLLRNIALLLALVGLALSWRYTPLSDWLNLERLFALIAGLRELPAAPLLVIAGFVLGGLVVMPVLVLVVVTVLAFGPMQGFALALIGSLLSGFATYGLGHWLGRETVRRFAGARINKLSLRLARRGVLAMAVIRLLPIAPYSIVNVVAGASHIRFRDFALGTLLGLTPGLVAITLFVDRIAASLQNPEPQNFVWLALVALVIALGAWFLRRILKQRRAAREAGG